MVEKGYKFTSDNPVVFPRRVQNITCYGLPFITFLHREF